MSEEVVEVIEKIISTQFKIHFNESNQHQEWLDLKSAAKYAGVSYNTFIKFRYRGLKVAEVDGTKRVKKSEIDRFLNENSF